MARTEPLRILIIEDHHDSRAALQRLLERQGHVVCPADSIAAALAVARASPLDLVIGDIGLPDGNGCDVMRMLRETRHIPSIAVSGFADDEVPAAHRVRPVGSGDRTMPAARVSATRGRWITLGALMPAWYDPHRRRGGRAGQVWLGENL
jgi:CheY-like chemotaxis protein